MSKVWDNPEAVVIGDVLHSQTSDYRVESFSGRGTFGLVAKCLHVATNTKVAIKMINNTPELSRCTAAEISVLQKLRQLDPDKCHIVRWYDHFSDRGSSCLVFEQLDRSLQDFMVERNWAPLHIAEIRPIVQQAASALSHLEALQLVHGDIKLPNIMLVNHGGEPLKIKLIDFGLTCKVAATRPGQVFQTLPYRCPEVFLGLPLTVSIDMWSLGCVAAELLLGNILFVGMTDYDMMVQIIQTVGQPPDHLLSAGLKTSCFFARNPGCPMSAWKVKTMEQYHAETGEFTQDLRRHNVRSLEHLLVVHHFIQSLSPDYLAEMMDMLMFVDMLKKMLMTDASQRITPQQLLQHQFISMSHIKPFDGLSLYSQVCQETMKDFETPAKMVDVAPQSPEQATVASSRQMDEISPVSLPHPPPGEVHLQPADHHSTTATKPKKESVVEMGKHFMMWKVKKRKEATRSSARKSPGGFQTSTSRAKASPEAGSILPPAEPQPQPVGPDVSQAGKLPPECRRKEVLLRRKTADSKSPARPCQRSRLHQLRRGLLNSEAGEGATQS